MPVTRSRSKRRRSLRSQANGGVGQADDAANPSADGQVVAAANPSGDGNQSDGSHADDAVMTPLYLRWHAPFKVTNSTTPLSLDTIKMMAAELKYTGSDRFLYLHNNRPTKIDERLETLQRLYALAIARSDGSADDGAAAFEREYLEKRVQSPLPQPIVAFHAKLKADDLVRDFTHGKSRFTKWWTTAQGANYDNLLADWTIYSVMDDDVPNPSDHDDSEEDDEDATDQNTVSVLQDVNDVMDLALGAKGLADASRSRSLLDDSGGDPTQSTTTNTSSPSTQSQTPMIRTGSAMSAATDGSAHSGQHAHVPQSVVREQLFAANKADFDTAVQLAKSDLAYQLQLAQQQMPSALNSWTAREQTVTLRLFVAEAICSEITYWRFNPKDYVTDLAEILGSDPMAVATEAAVSEMLSRSRVSHAKRGSMILGQRAKRFKVLLKGRKVPEAAWPKTPAKPQSNLMTLPGAGLAQRILAMPPHKKHKSNPPHETVLDDQKLESTNSSPPTAPGMMHNQFTAMMTQMNTFKEEIVSKMDLQMNQQKVVKNMMNHHAYGLHSMVVTVEKKTAIAKRARKLLDADKTMLDHREVLNIMIEGTTRADQASRLEGLPL